MTNYEPSAQDILLEKRTDRDYAREVLDTSSGLERLVGKIGLWRANRNFEKAAITAGLIVVNGDVIKPTQVSADYFNRVEDDGFYIES